MKKNILLMCILGMVGCGGSSSDELVQYPSNSNFSTVSYSSYNAGTTVSNAGKSSNAGNNKTPANLTAQSTSTDPGFNFRVDRDFTLIIDPPIEGRGVINVYHDYAFHDKNRNVYYPDYRRRVTSFYPSLASSITLQVNNNWEHLVLEFVPNSADGEERYTLAAIGLEPELRVSFAAQ